MKFEETFDFDYPADVIMRMFGDKDYYLAKYQRMGGNAPELLDHKESADTFEITVRHALDAANLKFPDFIKSRIGDSLYLKQTDTWHASRKSGRIDIDIEKAPVDVRIDMMLADRDSGSRMTMNFDIKAGIPLIGGKIEKAVAGPMTKYTLRDLALTNKMASDYA